MAGAVFPLEPFGGASRLDPGRIPGREELTRGRCEHDVDAVCGSDPLVELEVARIRVEVAWLRRTAWG